MFDVAQMSKPAALILLSIAMVSACRCTHGKLHVDLVAAPAVYTIEGHKFQGMVYNGRYMPPLWRVCAGDIVTVTLHNQLAEETNLHFHGLGGSPLSNGDNVFLHIAPGQTFTYEIRIPEKHVGLFWYHPHAHGDVDRQIIGGCPEESLLQVASAYILS
jgi:FtsP/CotA-like multicopper oxidase with cupredoxin domain